MRNLLILSLCVTGSLQGASFTTIGNLKPNAHSQIGAQVSGKIEEVYVDVGDSVTKEQPLAKLSSALFENDCAQKESSLEAAQIELSNAQLNHDRMQKLWNKLEGPSISQKRLEDADTQLKQAQLHVKQAQEGLNRARTILNDATIKAPFDGVITKRLVDPGEAITSAPVTQIIEVQSIDPLYLEFAVPESYLSWLHKNSLISYEVEGLQGKQTATVERIYPHVEETTRSVKCRAVIPNPEKKFRSGSLVKVELHQP